jgi:hypothetical protein
MRLSTKLVAAVIGPALGACQSGPRTPAPALLMQGDTLAMDRLMTALSTEMQRTRIDLGPSDPTRSPVIAVLPLPPGPLEDRSLALPTLFHLEWEGKTCWLVRDETGARHELDGVNCRAAPAQ